MSILHEKEQVVRIVKEITKGFFGGDIQVRVRRTPLLISVLWRESDQEMCGFTLIEQPNCCGAMVSTRTFVNKPHTGQGIAQEMMSIKEALAKEFGYSALAATVNMTGNPAEVHILEKFGWVKGWEFKNARTKNQVGFFFKTL